MPRHFLALALCYAVVAPLSPGRRDLLLGQTPDTTTSVQRAIREAEAARFRAMVSNDFTSLDTLLGADLTYTHTSGERQGKVEFESMLRTGDLAYLSAEPESVFVRAYGATAVADGRARMRVRSHDKVLAFTIRFLEVYALRRGRWELVAWQSTRLTGPADR